MSSPFDDARVKFGNILEWERSEKVHAIGFIQENRSFCCYKHISQQMIGRIN